MNIQRNRRIKKEKKGGLTNKIGFFIGFVGIVAMFFFVATIAFAHTPTATPSCSGVQLDLTNYPSSGNVVHWSLDGVAQTDIPYGSSLHHFFSVPDDGLSHAVHIHVVSSDDIHNNNGYSPTYDYPHIGPCHTATPTNTSTATSTNTATATATNTSTDTPSPTSSPTFTNTPTDTETATFTVTSSHTPTQTFTFTPTSTWTWTATNTATPTETFTVTATFSPTLTFTFTPTDTSTATETFTITSTDTPTFTKTPTASDTQTPTYTASWTATNTATATSTDTDTPTATNTVTVEFTQTSSDTREPSLTPSATMTATRHWVPSADSCDVYDWAFAIDTPMDFGIVGWQPAGQVPYDQYIHNKRGLVFDHGVLKEGMQVYVIVANQVHLVFDVHIDANGIPHCVQNQLPPSTPTPVFHAHCLDSDVAASVSSDQTALFGEAACDPPHFTIFVNGKKIFDEDFEGSRMWRINPSDDVLVFVNGELKYHFEPKS